MRHFCEYTHQVEYACCVVVVRVVSCVLISPLQDKRIKLENNGYRLLVLKQPFSHMHQIRWLPRREAWGFDESKFIWGNELFPPGRRRWWEFAVSDQTSGSGGRGGEVRISNLTFEVAFPFSVTAPYVISRKCVWTGDICTHVTGRPEI